MRFSLATIMVAVSTNLATSQTSCLTFGGSTFCDNGMTVIDVSKPPRDAGTAPSTLMEQINKRIDPKGQMPEAQRMMASYSALWQYHMRRGQFDEAQTAAFGLLQVYRYNTARYARLARVAAEGSPMDTAAQIIAKAFVNVSKGANARITKEGDRLVYEATDERTGQVIRKGILTPQEIGAWVLDTTPDRFDKLINRLAGQEMSKPEKPQDGEGAEPSLADREIAANAIAATYKEAGQDLPPLTSELKYAASSIYVSNITIGPKDALVVASRLFSPKHKPLREPKVLDDGTRVVELEDGRLVKISRNTWLQGAAMRGAAERKAAPE
jgi:hypothetical protein